MANRRRRQRRTGRPVGPAISGLILRRGVASVAAADVAHRSGRAAWERAIEPAERWRRDWAALGAGGFRDVSRRYCRLVTPRGLAGVEERVHDFGAVGKGGADLVTVYAFGDAGAAVAEEASYLLKADVVRAEQADEGAQFPWCPVLARSCGLGDRAE